MKSVTIIILILLVVSIAMIVTKPSNQDCYNQIMDKVNNEINNSRQNEILKVIEEVSTQELNKYMPELVSIEDNVLFKNIYVTGTDIKIGVGIFGTVIIEGDNIMEQLKEKIGERIANEMPGNNSKKKKIVDLFKKKGLVQSNNNQNISINNANSNPNLILWENRLQVINADVKTDNLNIEKVKRFHIRRTHGNKEQELNDAEVRLEQDEYLARQYTDSVEKYQEQ
jgi:hypothetical protein